MRRIKNSLSAKVFLWVMSALILCSMLIYGIVMIVVPHGFTAVSNGRINGEIEKLTSELNNTDFKTASEIISDFCAKNFGMAAMLAVGADSFSFGDFDNIRGEDKAVSTSVVLAFPDCEEAVFLTVISTGSSADELNGVFIGMIPFVLGAILLVSAVSAWLCSRAIVTPVLKISRVSKRMAKLDMTWHCDVDRGDELGVLADSLNTLSIKLGEAMEELEDTNKRLREEIKKVNAAEKQRRDFFAAASHELKTPITVLKGQIESMILEIGRYKDVKSVLPETLVEIEKTERLVKEILSVSKLEINGLGEKNEKIDVSECLREVIEALTPLAFEKDIEIVFDTDRPTVYIEGNTALFRKALHNILSNAVFHSPKGSKVKAELSGEKLTVVNTGVTLPEEEIHDLFTPFYRVEKSRNKDTGGSGLGLYLVETILRLHRLSFDISNGDNCVIFTVLLNQN